jgi:hypothetical protein
MTCRIHSIALGAAVFIAGSSAIAFAGGVRIVEATGTQNFSDIASAVAAAPDGAVLLVGQGNYSGFSISAKSISIFAVPGATVNVTQPISIVGIAVDQTVVLSGMHVETQYPQLTFDPELSIDGCAGTVRVQSCSIKAYDWDAGFCPGPLLAGRAGARVTNSTRVGFTNCTITGGQGEGLYPDDVATCTPAAPGGPGVEIVSGSVAIYDSIATGGIGGGSKGTIGHGGPGLELDSGTMFASASTFHGGTGGASYLEIPMACGGTGGDGCALSGSATFYEVGCSFQGGSQGFFPCGGHTGQPISGGSLTSLPGPARVMTIAPLVKGDLGAWSVNASGAAGDRDYLLASLSPGFQITPAFHGAWLELRSALLPPFLLGTGASIATSAPAPDLAPGSLFERRFTQLATRASGQVYLGSAAVLLLIDRDSGPDCNGNGLNDFVEVIENPASDANHNLIPDGCPGG